MKQNHFFFIKKNDFLNLYLLYSKVKLDYIYIKKHLGSKIIQRNTEIFKNLY